MWKFLNSVTVVGGSLIAFLGFAAGQPEIQSILPTKYMPIVMAIAALGIVLARFRDGAGKSITPGQTDSPN